MYFERDPAQRVRRPLRRRPVTGSGVSDADAQFIREVAKRYPRFTDAEVRWACGRQGRDDITVQMVREVLGA